MHKKNMGARNAIPAASEKLLTSGLFLLPTLSLTFPSGYSYAAVIITVGATVFRLSSRTECGSSSSLPGPVRLIIFFFVLYAAFWMGDAAIRGEGMRGFDRPSRFLLAAFCLAVIARTRITPTSLWIGLAIGSIGAGGIAIWQRVIEDASRASGFVQTIEFGAIAMLMGSMCVTGLIWTSEPLKSGLERLLLSGLFLNGFIAGITASILSGSRGAWLALLPAILIILWAARRLTHTRNYLLAGLVLGILAVAITYSSPNTGVASRIAHAAQQVDDYIDGHTDSSIGYRLEMWRGSTRLFAEKPLIGWGEVAYMRELKELGEAGIVNPEISRYAHAHNEWFNVFAKKGVAGGLILLGVYVTPLIWFIRIGRQSTERGNEDQSRFALATAGIVFSSGFMATGMTQVNFNHNVGVMVYVFMIAALVGILSNKHWRK